MREIPLSGKSAGGRVALIDNGDLDLVSAHHWFLWERLRCRRPNGPYALTNLIVNGRQVRTSMHQMITGWPMTDHMDHNGLNNQRYNLQPTTTARNNHNQRPYLGHSSRYKGVTWHRQARKWQAAIKVDGRCVYLGLFASEEEAALAYNTAALNVFGMHAYQNEVAA